jgi:CxxC motif-containing protein (DUF1111 family)
MRHHAPLLLVALVLAACSEQTAPSTPIEPKQDAPLPSDNAPSMQLSLANALSAHTAFSGGDLTVFDLSLDAFGFPAPNLSAARLDLHEEGDEAFEAAFGAIGSPNPGLGPVFDNVSCESCHVGDGRGRAPNPGEQAESFLYRASIAGKGPHNGPNPVPGFGTQLQLRGAGISPDVTAVIQYVENQGVFGDGTAFSLRAPTYTLTGAYQGLPAGVLVSPRAAPAMLGLGLLEAVPQAEILGIAVLQAVTRQVSGKPNWVWNEVLQRVDLGRFGWKANNPSLVQQTAGAYNGDMGITSNLFPAEGCEGTDPLCARHAAEVDDDVVAAVAFYSRTLGVPARRNLNDPLTRQGELLFHTTGCANCHVATLRTGFLAGVPEVSNQTIHPYTDLLVHDMGPGLADNRPDFQANGQEWRTAPLWGIGLVQIVNGHTNFLHDGRARNLLEAILWHGGEAAAAQAKVKAMSVAQRAALLAFLQSL